MRGDLRRLEGRRRRLARRQLREHGLQGAQQLLLDLDHRAILRFGLVRPGAARADAGLGRE
jgi:hypothetical protein